MNEETTAVVTQPGYDKFAYYRDNWRREQQRYGLCIDIINRLGERLSESVNFSPCVYISITVNTREDLAVLMTLAPKWTKTPGVNGITYSATVDGEDIQIQAQQAALPGTCKLVEEEYEIPAVEAKPATVGKRMVLKCDNLEKTP